MIKLLCPNCMRTVSVPDDAAGKETPCPECGKPFAVPARYTPVVNAPPPPAIPPAPVLPPPVVPEPAPMSSDRPPPPPGLVPPVYPPPGSQLEPPLPAPPPPPPVPFGYTHSRGITISPRALAWVPAVCLTVIFLLTFFPWVGSYVGGSAVYRQNAWRELSGYPDANQPLADLMQRQAAWPDRVLDRVKNHAELMLPYVLALIFALLIAWVERMVATLDRNRLPPQFRWVAAAWPYRIPIVAALATVALLLLAAQMSRGFGLERAFRETVSEKFAEQRKASADSPQAQAAIDFKEEEELARFNLERTTWLYLALVLHILVVLAMVARSWLDRRGNKPAPRIVFQY